MGSSILGLAVSPASPAPRALSAFLPCQHHFPPVPISLPCQIQCLLSLCHTPPFPKAMCYPPPMSLPPPLPPLSCLNPPSLFSLLPHPHLTWSSSPLTIPPTLRGRRVMCGVPFLLGVYTTTTGAQFFEEMHFVRVQGTSYVEGALIGPHT